MSLRCIWIFNLSKDDFGTNLLYRNFPTVEKRCKSAYGMNYVSIPSPSVFGNSLMVKIGLAADAKQFVEFRDKASRVMQLPVVEVNINKQVLWPVISIVQNSLLVCCLTFVDEFATVDKTDLLKIPSVSVGFSVLLGIHNFLGTISNLERRNKMIDLENFLNLNLPFGAPSDLEISSAAHFQKFNTQKFLKRQPAWKPFEYKGKQTIHCQIHEFVRCVQSDQAGGISQLQIFGQISVAADLEGSLNDISVSLIAAGVPHTLNLDSMILHPCVNVHGGFTLLGPNAPKRFRFSPPPHEFVLLQYCSSMPKDPPIFGTFKMRGEDTVELLLQLKLNPLIKNNFDYCDIIIVFFNRGPVKTMELNASHGSPRLSEDKYSLKWSIGAKFPKDLEALLSAKIVFLDEPVMPGSDPFCLDKNCYAQIIFKQSNNNLSGCSIDPKNVTTSEGNKAKVIIDRSVQSTEYRIWNNYGDVPFPVNIKSKYDKVFS